LTFLPAPRVPIKMAPLCCAVPARLAMCQWRRVSIFLCLAPRAGSALNSGTCASSTARASTRIRTRPAPRVLTAALAAFLQLGRACARRGRRADSQTCRQEWQRAMLVLVARHRTRGLLRVLTVTSARSAPQKPLQCVYPAVPADSKTAPALVRCVRLWVI